MMAAPASMDQVYSELNRSLDEYFTAAFGFEQLALEDKSAAVLQDRLCEYFFTVLGYNRDKPPPDLVDIARFKEHGQFCKPCRGQYFYSKHPCHRASDECWYCHDAEHRLKLGPGARRGSGRSST